MYSSKNYLKKRNKINNVFKKGRTIAGNLFFAKILKNNLRFSRFAVIVNLKVSKKATQRNAIKRRLKEATRKNFSATKQGFDILVFAKPEIINKKYQEIAEEIKKLL